MYDYKPFVVGTTITVIAAFLGGPATLAVKVLTLCGVAIAAGDTLKSAVTLYKSASYSFSMGPQGYVYDKTTQFSDVLVVNNLKQGVFTGGINKDGQWTWIISDMPINTLTNDVIIARTLSYYTSALMQYGGNNQSFFPERP